MSLFCSNALMASDLHLFESQTPFLHRLTSHPHLLDLIAFHQFTLSSHTAVPQTCQTFAMSFDKEALKIHLLYSSPY